MDVFLFILGTIFILVGLSGCILPIIPGPPISYGGLLLLQLSSKQPFTTEYMWLLAGIVVVVTVIDNVVPIWSTKKFGGSKWGTWGSAIGLVIGFFFAPLGIIIGPFAGAVIGELISGKDSKIAFRSGFAALLGFVFGTGLKLATSGWVTYEFFSNLF